MMNNQESIVKKFFNRIKDFKRMNSKELKLTEKEVEELAWVINDMLIRLYGMETENKNNENNQNEEYNVTLSGGEF